MSDVMSVRLWLEGTRVLEVEVEVVSGLVAVPVLRVRVPSGVGPAGEAGS